MLNPFIDLISHVITLINWALIIWLILDVLINFDVINKHNQLIQRVYTTLGRLIEPLLRPIRRLLAKYLPNLGGIDISPIILILLLNFFNNALYTWFYDVQPHARHITVEQIDDGGVDDEDYEEPAYRR